MVLFLPLKREVLTLDRRKRLGLRLANHTEEENVSHLFVQCDTARKVNLATDRCKIHRQHCHSSHVPFGNFHGLVVASPSGSTWQSAGDHVFPWWYMVTSIISVQCSHGVRLTSSDTPYHFIIFINIFYNIISIWQAYGKRRLVSSWMRYGAGRTDIKWLLGLELAFVPAMAVFLWVQDDLTDGMRVEGSTSEDLPLHLVDRVV